MERIIQVLNDLAFGFDMELIDFVEILILAVLFYYLVIWIKNTKTWMLLKGIVVVACFILIAFGLKMTTIIYLVEISMSIIATVAIVVFQPEIRRALENLGQRNILFDIVPFDKKKENAKFSPMTRNGIVDACMSMSAVKTGALIVIENTVKLVEYENTGIKLDCLVSSQILLNIFEHNTPLHDGAIIISGDRITAATCYLPLTDNMSLSKELGTRHRAAIGMSEVSDALVIAVSEETGRISVASNGNLERNMSRDDLRDLIERIRVIDVLERKRTMSSFLRRNGGENEK